MGGIVGPRINQGKPLMAEQKTVGTSEGIGAAIGRGNPHQARADRHGNAGLRVKFPIEGEGGSHCTPEGVRL